MFTPLAPSTKELDPEELESSYDEDDDSDRDDDAETGRGRKAANKVTTVVGSIFVSSFIFALVLVAVASRNSGNLSTIRLHNQARLNATTAVTVAQMVTGSVKVDHMQVSLIGNMLGETYFKKLTSGALAGVAFFCVVIATITATIEINRYPHLVPKDFETKGTLSNVCQDTSTTPGRMFSVGLFTYGLLLIVSMYTTWVYRSWAPWVDLSKQPFNTPAFQSNAEKNWRVLWVVVPNVFFMFTAAFPSSSDTSGLQFYMMLAHNICAPTAMLCVVLLETTQLHWGENAFAHFFCDEHIWPGVYDHPLYFTQRLRCVTVIYTWISFIVFMGCQVYLGLGTMLGMKIKTSYTFAMVSFYGEVIGLLLVAFLPFLAAMGSLVDSIGLPCPTEMALAMMAHEL